DRQWGLLGDDAPALPGYPVVPHDACLQHMRPGVKIAESEDLDGQPETIAARNKLTRDECLL
ncbi:unnamed protein product, partial [Amoebophrya sp. A25]